MEHFETASKPSKGVRLLLVAISLGLMGIFAIASWLEPDVRGFGTHQQLGLPPCQFRQFLGVSCPHCGMTTSFSNVVRGRFQAAWNANPLGLPLSVTWALCIPWCLSVAVSGRWLGTEKPFQWLVFGSIGYLLLAVLLWANRMWL